MKKLLVIDGNSILNRAFYAIMGSKALMTPDGTYTNAVYGFLAILFKMMEDEKPDYLVVAFDVHAPTFRHEMYAEYKGTRDETPQLVIDSLEPLCGICKALQIPVLLIPGFEADDVIGSMAKRAEKEGFTVYMVTPDKDYGQLISPSIIQYKPGKSGSEHELIDVNKVCEKYNISSPEQVIEILTIMGDSSDNVPGVKGVGEVGAGKLISKYGSVAEIYTHIDELTPKQREAFENSRSYIDLSHTLVTIKTDIPLDVTADDMDLSSGYSSAAADLFEEYEFGSLRRYLGDIKPTTVKEEKKISTKECDVKEIIAKAEQAGCCSVVIEDNNVTIAVPAKEELSCYTADGSIQQMESLLMNAEVAKFGYSLKGLNLCGKLMDIELMHYLIDPEKSHKLDILARTYLGVNLEETAGEEPKTESLSLFDDPVEEEETNHAVETAACMLLGRCLENELKERDLTALYDTMEEPLLKVLAKMEHEGVKLDVAQLRKYATELATELNEIQDRIREMADEPNLNIMSPKQVGVLLYEKLNLAPKVKPKSGVRYNYPTDEDTLSSLADKHPIINEILEYRGVKKLLSTYIEPFPSYISPETGKIHTTFNQSLTATGRLSSSKPNLQNIPIRTERGKEIRKAFIPSHPDGVILSADYSQIELRIMAHLSCDAHLINAFRNGEDVHAMTAAKIFGIKPEEVTADQRRIAKTANFGIMYGISAFGLSQRLHIGRAEAKKIIEDYFANFPAISSYIEDTLASAREFGYVETVFGRRRYLPEINARNATARALAERTAINAPIQGTSADIIKMAMINVDRRISEAGLQSRMVLQIHDELVFDAVREEVDILQKIVKEEMENVIELSVPLTVECNYGNNWLEAH